MSVDKFPYSQQVKAEKRKLSRLQGWGMTGSHVAKAGVELTM